MEKAPPGPENVGFLGDSVSGPSIDQTRIVSVQELSTNNRIACNALDLSFSTSGNTRKGSESAPLLELARSQLL